MGVILLNLSCFCVVLSILSLCVCVWGGGGGGGVILLNLSYFCVVLSILSLCVCGGGGGGGGGVRGHIAKSFVFLCCFVHIKFVCVWGGGGGRGHIAKSFVFLCCFVHIKFVCVCVWGGGVWGGVILLNLSYFVLCFVFVHYFLLLRLWCGMGGHIAKSLVYCVVFCPPVFVIKFVCVGWGGGVWLI